MEDNKNKTKVDLMYDDLFEQGYLEKDRDTFNKFFYAPGEQGYKNRKALYDDLHEQGYLESPTYEDFAKGIGLHAVDGAQQPSSTNTSAAASGVVGGVSGGLTPGSYAQAYAQGTQGNGRPDMVEALNKYYEGLQAKNTPQAHTKQPEAPAPSTGVGSSSTFGGGESSGNGASASYKVVTDVDGSNYRVYDSGMPQDLYQDEKGNIVNPGMSEEELREVYGYKPKYDSGFYLYKAPSYTTGGVAYRTPLDSHIQKAKDLGMKHADHSNMSKDELLAERARILLAYGNGVTETPESLQDAIDLNDIEYELTAKDLHYKNAKEMGANRGEAQYKLLAPEMNQEYLKFYEDQGSGATNMGNNPLYTFGWERLNEMIQSDKERSGATKSVEAYVSELLKDKDLEDRFYAYCLNKARISKQDFRKIIDESLEDFKNALSNGENPWEYVPDEKDVMAELADVELDRIDVENDKGYDAAEKRYQEWRSKQGYIDPRNADPRDLYGAQTGDFELKYYDTAKHLSAQTRELVQEAMKGGDFLTASVRGLYNNIFKKSTWDFGLGDLQDADAIKITLDKFLHTKNPKISPGEQALLDSMAAKAVFSSFFEKYLTTGYKAGSTTAEAIPFILEMMTGVGEGANIAAKAATKWAARQLEKYGLKFLERIGMKGLMDKALKALAKRGGRTLEKLTSSRVGQGTKQLIEKVASTKPGQLAKGLVKGTVKLGEGAVKAGVGGVGYAVTTGALKTTKGAIERSTDTIDVGQNKETGRFEITGIKKAGEDGATAWLKSLGEQAGQYGSEMYGPYLEGLTGGLKAWGKELGIKAADKMGIGNLMREIGAGINESDMIKIINDFKKMGHYDGTFNEYLEEVANNIYNAAFIGDMNWGTGENGVFNKEDNIDTYLSCLYMSGLFGIPVAVSYRPPKYRAKQDVKRYGDEAKRIFGGHGNDWSTIANLIQDNSEEARKQLVVDLMQSGKYSKREKQIALQYAGAVYKSMGMDLGESKQKRSVGDQEASDAYGRGYNMANLENISETSGVYNQLRSQMEQEYGAEFLSKMDENPGSVYGWLRSGEVKEEDAQKVLNYLNAKMAYDGAMDRLNDDDAAAKAAAEAHVDDTIHTEENGGDGQIHPVALKGREGDFFVVSGNVVADNDGNVDVEASDNDIVVVDSDGNRIMTNAKNIGQVGEAIDPEAAKADAVAKIDGATQEVINGESGIIEEESGENGETLEDETQVESTTPEAATDTNTTQAPLAVEEYNQDDLVTVEVDGQQVTGIITNGLDNDGNVTIYFDEPINGRQNWQMTPEQLNKVAVSYTSRDGVKIDRSSEVGSNKEEVGETPQPQQQQTPGAPVQEQAPVSGESEEPLQQPAANGELDVQTGETPQTPNAPVAEAPQQAPAQPSLPIGEDGNADFSNASVQEAHDYIYNDPELDEDEANQAVTNKLKGAQNRLDQAQAALDQAQAIPAPSMEDYGEDTAGYKRAKRERNEAIAQAQAAVDAAQRDVDLWQGVQAQHMMNRAAANAAANRAEESGQSEETPAPGTTDQGAPASGENENNAPTPSQATPAQGQQTTESTQAPSAPQPNEGNGPVASTTPSSSEEERGESEEAPAAEQPTTTADERIENARIARLIQRAEQLAATCGIPVRICKSEDEIPARYKKAFETAKGEGKKKSFVNGFFYNKKTANGELNEIVLYIPDIAANGGMWRLERTFLHEAVAHGGLRALFENAQDGIQTFNDLCDKVWNEIMPSGEKRDKRDYVLQNKYGAERYEEIKKQYRKEGKSLDDLMTDELKREAADEYMAHLAEEGTDKTLLEKVIQAVRDALRKIKLIDKKFNDMDIVDLLAASRRNLTEMDRQVLNQDVADELDRLALAGEDNGGSTLMSTTSIMEGGGLEVSREVVDKDGKVTKEPLVDDEGNLVARYNGKEYSAKNPITADDLREGDVEGNEATVLQMLINDARDAKNISDEQAAKIYQNYADMINLFLKCGSAENGGADTVMENWEWLGDTVFRAVAANGDAQYSYSMDITKVCKKNEAVIKSISALQLREGRGATPSEIVEIYRDTHVEGYQVPCPVCYVFTRYIRNGKYASAAITGMEEYGEHLPGGKKPWTLKQWRDELNRLDRTMNPDSKQKRTDAEKEQAKRFKKQLDEANDITVYYEDRVNALSFLLTSKFTSEARKKEILEELRIIDAQYKAAVNIIARQSLTNWIKTFAIQEKDGKWSMREDAKKPEDMDDFRINALDLRLTSNTILNYPAIQRLRKSSGSAAGKEISFESDNRLGEVVSGLGINKSNLNTYSNVYEEVLKAPNEKERKKLRKKATERFQAASEYAQQQTLRGGQRMWSWSDNIERLSPDIAINIMQLQLLGGAMQTYSKQLEGIKLAAQMGAYVNGSLMAKDNGWEEVKDSECYERDGELWLKKDKYDVVNEPRVGKRPRKRKRIIAAKDAHVYQAEDGKKYVLVYDDIVGVDPFGNEHDGKRKKGLFQLNKELDRAGNILVGMNDLHVRAAMADPAVFFIIPWHASGANNHILNEMLEVLGQRMTERLDYTVMQEEKNMLDRNKDTKKLPEVTQRLRDLWEEGRQWAKQNKWKSGMEVDSNGDLITESQYMYRALRGLIFDGSIFEAMPTEEQYQEAVEIVTNMQATVDELNARNEAWKQKSPEYKKSPEGKAEKKEIDDARTKANKAYKPAVHTIELHDGLIDWRDSSVNAEDAEWQAQHPKRINVEEARRIIEADEFLKQVYDRVSKTPGQKMTSGDNTYIYPYEYWQETDAKGKPADIKDADINGKRYVEYCRRMGYKPKFSGNWKTGDVEKQNQGNFVHDPGYWKLLIDRRMYDRNGKYQWLDPVDSDNFETSLVDPRETHKEFHVTTVADDKAADEIAQKVFERLSTRTESGFAAADYNKPLKKIMDEYDAALEVGVQNGKIKLTAAEESLLERMKAATVEEAEEAEDSGVMFSMSKSTEEFDRIRERAKAERGIVAPNLARRMVKVTGVDLHDFSGRPSEAKEKAKEWALENIADNDKVITIHEGTQDEFAYIISKDSVKEFFEGSAIRNAEPYEIAGYLSVIKKIHEVVENCVETEVHPDYLEKDEEGHRDPNGKIGFDVLIHEYRGVINVDGQPFHIKLIFKETRNKNQKNPLYAYSLDTIKLSGVTSEERSDELVTPTLYAPDSFISGAKLWEKTDKSYDPGKKLLAESEKSSETTENGNGMMMSTSPSEERTLMGVHNITADKLKSAIGLGGLANPSMAVVDTTKGLLNNFGEISLIPGSALIDSKTGRNAGTWAADAYTPRFPKTHKRLGKGGDKKLKQWLKDLGMRQEMTYNTEEQFNDYYNGFDIQDNVLVYPFLYERGMADAVDTYDHNKVSAPYRALVEEYKGDLDALMDAFDNNEEVMQQVTDIVIDDIVKEGVEKQEGESFSEWKKRRRALRQEISENYLNMAGYLDRDIARDILKAECAKYVEVSRFNPEATRQAASIYIDKNGLREEYNKYRDEKLKELGAEIQMYAGSDSYGRSKFKPVTLEAVSREMKKQGRAGAESGFGVGPGGVRARVTPRLNTLKQIKGERGRIQNDIDSILQEYTDEFFETARNIFNGSTDILGDVLASNDMRAAAKEHGYELEDSTIKALNDFRDRMVSLPTEYFETKFERPVALNEFEAAIVPNDVDPEIRETLEDVGLDVREYNPEEVGDRERVTLEAANEAGNVLFSTTYSLGVPYQGTKGKIARSLMEKLPSGRRFVDLFAGGGAMTHAALLSGKYDEYHMNDVNPIGVELFMQGLRGEWDDYNRTSMTPEEFKQIKGTPEAIPWSVLGLGRNLVKGGKPDYINRVKRLGQLKDQADRVSNSFEDYRNVEIRPGDVVYADIPYENTDTYNYGKGRKFDKKAFCDWAQAQDFPIFVSESVMPEGWVEIASESMKTINPKKKRVEKLWVQEKFADDYREKVESDNAAEPSYEANNLRFSVLDPERDADLIADLDGQEYVTVYRTMAKVNGEYYPPMDSRDHDNPEKLRNPEKLGQYTQSEERPDLAYPEEYTDKKTGEKKTRWKFNLRKSNGKSVDGVAYNPYMHTSDSALNDQFSEAQDRDDLVVVECRVPVSELDPNSYHAEKALDPVGWKPWKAGPIVSKMTGKRNLLLSRWVKPVKELSWSEVADKVSKQLGDQFDVLPSNTFSKGLRAELEKRGYKFIETDNKGIIKEGLYKGVTWSDRYYDIHPELDKRSNKKAKRAKVAEAKARNAVAGEGLSFSTSEAVATLKDDERVYNDFLGKVFSGVSNGTRRGIVETAMRDMGNDFGAATESWLMGLADDGKFAQVPEEDWRTVKNALSNTLRDNGVDGTMTDNEARYVLWKAGQIEDGVFSMAEDIVMQDRLLPGESGVRFSVSIGGNSGYVGYSMSKRASAARDEGRYPKTDFKRKYKVSGPSLDALVSVGVIDDSEWHHTSKYGNKTTFYGWSSGWHAGVYAENKKAIDSLSKKLVDNDKDFFTAVNNGTMDQEGADRYTDVKKDLLNRIESFFIVDPIYTDNFKDWFGDWENDPENASKVVDKDGRPLVVYRGGEEINVFEPDRASRNAMYGQAFYATPSYADAQGFAKERTGDGSNVQAVYLDVRNPWVDGPSESLGYPKEATMEQARELVDLLTQKGLVDGGIILAKWNDGRVRSLIGSLSSAEYEGVERGKFDWWHASNIVQDALKELGYDGVIGRFDSGDGMVDQIAVFSPTQIKSATDNNGDFSRENPDIRFSVTPRDRAIARDQYERYMRSGRLQWVEAMQDSMLGLKKLMQAIMGSRWTKIEDVPMYENPYIAENLMSSVTAAQQQAFYTEFMKPLLKEVGKLCKGGKKAREQAREDLTNYLMAKHGLERNQVLADRDAQETAAAGGDYQEAYAENRKHDYSGLTALTGEDNVQAAEAKAQQMVADYEAQHDTTELWNKINAATQVTLEKQYKSGMLSYAEYQRISGMFDYYVPLRGWEETTSDQVYGYLTSKAGPFLGGGIVKRAGGRTSKADDPIATIAQMGDDSIRTGNRNLMKQTFLNFVQNHPSDLVSVSDLWLKYDDVTDEWVPVFADIEPNDSADVVEQKIQDFEQRMQELAEQEPRKYKHGREAANIPYRVIPGMEKEHQVLVKRNGQTWVLTINGNPRAAQALNGLTNPDVPMEGAWASMIKGAEWVNRTLSALYTTLSPAFIVSNFLRDTGYSNTMVWVREKSSWKFKKNYPLRFNYNYLKLNPAYMRFLLGRWEKGTLDESKRYQKYMKEFMLHGGETGFAMVQDLEKYKQNMLNEVKNMNSKNFARKSMKVLGSQYELLGRSIENCARFAAYVTSREMGRSAERAAYDAKEISVNFNKKGSGGKSLGKVGQTMSGNVGAFISGMARSLYTFWNAGVQGMTNAGRAVKRHPVKAALLGAGPLYAAGFLAPVLAQLMGAGGDGDDDKNAYYNLPEYVRRSNLCIWLGDSWLTIPLPIEFRSIYGMGELTYGVISGNERYSDEELAMQVAGQFSQLLPIDMLEGGGGFHPFIPTLFKPIVEAEQNKSWSGLPIYRDSEWNKDEPEYTKAFSNANEWIVSGAEWLNAKTGGDEFKKGWIDLNPAKIEYMLKGYLGGIYTTIDEVRRAAETALGKRDFEWRNIPLANRVIKQGDERTESKKLRDEYFKYKEDYEETKRLINKYKNAEDTDLFDYAKKLELMNYSKEYGRYLIFEKYATMLDAYQKAKKGASGEVLKKIEEDEKRLMRQLVDEMHAFEDGKTTVNDRPKLSKKDRSEDYGYMYNKLRTYIDINEDALLDSALKRAKAADDKGMVAALNSIKRSIGEMKKGLGHGKDEEVMNSIREMRGSVLRSFGIIDGGEEEVPEPEEQWQEEPQEEFQEEEPEMIEEEPLEEPEDDEFDESLSYE